MSHPLPADTILNVNVPDLPWGEIKGVDDGPAERPRATAADVEALLRLVNETLDVDLAPADLVGTFAGLRPLVGDPGGGSSVAVSREHRVWREPTGLVRISGGKYTTYRIMAQDAVDTALGADATRRPSATEELTLVGAAPRAQLGRLAAELGAMRGLEPGLARRLVARHGSEARAVLATGGAQPLGPDVEQLEAEVGWAVREELALSLDDVLARRLRLAMELPDRGAALAPRVAQLMAAELGWDERAQAAEIERYLASAHREYDVPA